MTVIGKEQILQDLREIGVTEGDLLGVGLSFKSIGQVVGGPDTLIDALLEAVGPTGTIMMPTFTRDFPSDNIEKDYIFDYRSTPTITGIVPETLRKRKGAIRSRHPIFSVTAIGKQAEYLTEGHNENSRGFIPYSRLAEASGKILVIGIGDRLVAFRHESQYQAGLLSIVPMRLMTRYRTDTGAVNLFVNEEYDSCLAGHPKLVQILRERKIVKDGRIGMAQAVLVPQRRAWT